STATSALGGAARRAKGAQRLPGSPPPIEVPDAVSLLGPEGLLVSSVVEPQLRGDVEEATAGGRALLRDYDCREQRTTRGMFAAVQLIQHLPDVGSAGAHCAID